MQFVRSGDWYIHRRKEIDRIKEDAKYGQKRKDSSYFNGSVHGSGGVWFDQVRVLGGQ